MNEYLTLEDVFSKHSLFTVYNEKYPNDIIEIYGKNDSNFLLMLDNLFLSLHGYKYINNTVDRIIDKNENEKDVIIAIVDYLHICSYDSIIKLKDIYNKKYNIFDNAQETYKETINNNSTSANNSTNENNNFSYGYNSETEVKDSKTTNTDNNTNTIESNNIKNYEKTYNNSGKLLSDIIDNEIERTIKNDYIKLTFTIFSSILTLSIY